MHQLHSRPGQVRDVQYSEVLRAPGMSVGTYFLPAGATDPQSPHTEDEIYIILEGRAILRTETGDALAVPGAALYVPAGEHHAFVEITQPLYMYVIFAPPEGAHSKAAQ